MAENGEDPEDQGNSSAPIPIPSPPPKTAAPPPLDLSSFTHTPFYCEENVYLLCKKLCITGIADQMGTDLFVVFISNEEKKSQKNEGGSAHHMVWDLDSSLPCPLPLDEYFTKAILPPFALNPKYSRLFRVVHAPIFLRFFASDRSHMKDHLGNWVSSPPTYKPITAEDGTENNLDEYIRMHAADIMMGTEALIDGVYSNKFGVVISETMLEDFFSQCHQR